MTLMMIQFLVDEYVKSLKGFPELQEKLAASYSEEGVDNREPLFPEHWPPSTILSAVKSGKIFQGTFYASRYLFLLIHIFQEMSLNN